MWQLIGALHIPLESDDHAISFFLSLSTLGTICIAHELQKLIEWTDSHKSLVNGHTAKNDTP